MPFVQPLLPKRFASAPLEHRQRAVCPRVVALSSSAPSSGKRARNPAPRQGRPGRSGKPTSGAHREAAEEFLTSLGLSREDVRRSITRLPRLAAEPDLAATARPMLVFLSDSLGLSARQVARAVRHAPHMLFREPADFAPRLAFLDSVARIPGERRAAAVAKCPHVLWMDVASATRVVDLVVDACPLITPESLGSVFARVPQALVKPPEQVTENIARIRGAGVSDAASMARIFAKVPLALVYDARGTVQKRLRFLSDELRLPPRTVGKVLVATPEVLEWGLDSVVRPRIAFLCSLVGEDHVPATLDKVPMVLGVTDVVDRVLWLRETVGLDEGELRAVVRAAPAVLTYSIVGNLAPKWAFLSETLGATKHDVVRAAPVMLCANLQQRAMPRYAFLASMGREDVPVVDMLQGSDVEFCKSVAMCDPVKYREYVDNDTYLLFFSRLL